MEYYYPLSRYFRETFGSPVRKVSVDARFSCPNRDGVCGTLGCIFCDNAAFSPARRNAEDSIAEQLDAGIARLAARYGEACYIAYFQPATNTYAPTERLAALYQEALRHEKIVGLAIGTRPDCLPEPTLDLLADFSQKTWLSLEIGLQTSHDQTLEFLRRGHDFACFADAVRRAKARNLRLGTHVILGLPGETRADVRATAERIAALGLHSVKLHNLYVVKNTTLSGLWETGQITLPTLEEYAALAVDFLERLSSETVIERLAGDAPRDFLLAPAWSTKKNAAADAIRSEFERRNSRQGALFRPKTPPV